MKIASFFCQLVVMVHILRQMIFFVLLQSFFEKIAEFAIILELNGYSGCMEIG